MHVVPKPNTKTRSGRPRGTAHRALEPGLAFARLAGFLLLPGRPSKEDGPGSPHKVLLGDGFRPEGLSVCGGSTYRPPLTAGPNTEAERIQAWPSAEPGKTLRTSDSESGARRWSGGLGSGLAPDDACSTAEEGEQGGWSLGRATESRRPGKGAPRAGSPAPVTCLPLPGPGRGEAGSPAGRRKARRTRSARLGACAERKPRVQGLSPQPLARALLPRV